TKTGNPLIINVVKKQLTSCRLVFCKRIHSIVARDLVMGKRVIIALIKANIMGATIFSGRPF
ncbi:MAG: hypothetical protein ACI901_000916, partial [Octadecabacter sp.]